MNDAIDIPEAFALLADWATKQGAAPLNKHLACWEKRLDETWYIAFNGHIEPTLAVGPVDGMQNVTVPPFAAAVWFNGWLGGFIHPGGGGVLGETSEDALIYALKAAGAETR